ncbi:sulfotransferase domain-containing protein [Mucilaginibacter sp.]|uniref:sulfotransferase domain-containing protein n=1 Tax=Mucilaginibacter sp. TaxID=1882438 RepID=UPI00284432EF|nr:sulfotransferase domain-containing protein [Mucilaginibacter sp.]MDR3697526.1 sulfotransferase domain-containing protein [Mucilaginibacter sp.]
MNNAALNEKKIIWLASYPKSGNTWFRAFLAALLNDEELDINDLKTDGIFSSRTIFEKLTDFDSTHFYDEEIKILQPEIFNHLALLHQKERLFIKVHDAYSYNNAGLPIVPTETTKCAIYIIRNPLDMAGSLASHFGIAIDRAIKMLNDPTTKLGNQYNLDSGEQFTQLMYDWSGHVKSWTSKLPFPVLIIRYEDMLADGLNTFTKAVNFMDIDISTEKIATAITGTEFHRLKQKEQANGFKETLAKNRVFFRKGQSGNWKNELNEQQMADIVHKHNEIMKTFNYLNNT